MWWFQASGTCDLWIFGVLAIFGIFSRITAVDDEFTAMNYLSVLIVCFVVRFVLMLPSKNMLFLVLGMQCLQITSIHLHFIFEVLKMRHSSIAWHFSYNLYIKKNQMMFYLHFVWSIHFMDKEKIAIKILDKCNEIPRQKPWKTVVNNVWSQAKFWSFIILFFRFAFLFLIGISNS